MIKEIEYQIYTVVRISNLYKTEYKIFDRIHLAFRKIRAFKMFMVQRVIITSRFNEKQQSHDFF